MQNLHHVMNKVNRKLFGNKARKGKAKLQCVAVLEQDGNGRWHYHLQMDCPNGIKQRDLADLFIDSWQNSRWGYSANDAKSARDEGWLKYMLKNQIGFESDLNIDWHNTHKIPSAV